MISLVFPTLTLALSQGEREHVSNMKEIRT